MIMSPLIKLKEHTTSIQILLIDAFSTPPLGFPPKVRWRGLGGQIVPIFCLFNTTTKKRMASFVAIRFFFDLFCLQ